MTQERIIYMMKQIDSLIRGTLSEEEEHQLWVEFLKAPGWYNLFETELNLTHLVRQTKKDPFL